MNLYPVDISCEKCGVKIGQAMQQMEEGTFPPPLRQGYCNVCRRISAWLPELVKVLKA